MSKRKKTAEWWERDDQDFVDDLWADYGFKKSSATSIEAHAASLAIAHDMVKTFVDTFATGDVPYTVTFDPTVATAGTDLESKKVVISPAPVMDPTLNAQQAGTILTAMACHEASHVRYGMTTAKATRSAFSGQAAADRLSNLIDDVRIERAFVRDYPGYSGIFGPALAYVAGTTLKAQPDWQPDPRTTDMAVAAIRYAGQLTFGPALASEVEWWQQWAERSMADTADGHVAAVREGLAHLADTAAPKPQPKPESGEGGEAGQGEAGEGPDAPGQAADQPAPAAPKDGKLSPCISDGIVAAAIANGVDRYQLDGRDAEEVLQQAKSLSPAGNGTFVDARRTSDLPGQTIDHAPVSGAATAAIRAAFMRSRGGHTAIDRGMTRGRCDNGSLYRIAAGDPRLFHRRTAPSASAYNIWVLVDWSGSMGGSTREAIAVSKALASASRYMATMRMAVFGWTTPSIHVRNTKGAKKRIAAAGVYRAWETGMSVDAIDELARIGMGGTPDSTVLPWATRTIVQESRRNETPVLIMASDGTGYLREPMVAKARAMGVRVISVAIGSGLSEDYQRETYGEGNFVTWKGSIEATARPLATMLGRMVAS